MCAFGDCINVPQARSGVFSSCTRACTPARAPVQQEEIKDDTYRSVYDRGLIPIYYRVQENAGEGPLKAERPACDEGRSH